jgi:hypothetical protein
VTCNVLAQRRAIDLAPRSTFPSGEAFGPLEDVVGNRDCSLHTRRITRGRLPHRSCSRPRKTLTSARWLDVTERRSRYAREVASADTSSHLRSRRLRLGALSVGALVVVAIVAIGSGALHVVGQRPPLSGDPPVLAGRQLWGSCAGGFYARRGTEVVLTSSAHCAREGTTAVAPDGRTVRGVFGPGAFLATCEHTEHTCRPSDMNYLVVVPDQIPWGRLDSVDMGDGGLRAVAPGTAPLSCADIAVGDRVEINGRDIFRSGAVAETGEYLHDPTADGDYFPCIIASVDIRWMSAIRVARCSSTVARPG